MLRLPAADSPLRQMFSVEDLALRLGSVPLFRDAMRSAAAMFEDRAVSSVNLVCRRMDGEIWLVQVGPKGGWKRLWNFGC